MSLVLGLPVPLAVFFSLLTIGVFRLQIVRSQQILGLLFYRCMVSGMLVLLLELAVGLRADVRFFMLNFSPVILTAICMELQIKAVNVPFLLEKQSG